MPHDLALVALCSADSVIIAALAFLVIYLIVRRDLHRFHNTLERRLHLMEIDLKNLRERK